MTLLGTRPSGAWLLAVAIGFGSLTAAAQTPTTPPPGIYNCQDADGRMISSDRPIAACSTRPMRELNQDGSMRRVIPAPLTKEQERQAAVIERQRLTEEAERRTRQARDRNLLLTFEDQFALEAMRSRMISEIDQEIVLATQRILSVDKELKAAQQSATAWKAERPGKSLPFVYQARINDAANRILADDALIADRRSERDRVNSRFDADSKRLRELLGKPEPDPPVTSARAQPQR